VSDVRRTALALLLGCLLLVAGVSALDGYDYYQTIEYAGCDQEIYQQDIVVHRTTGTAYEETVGPLRIWHIYVGDHCREDYGDVRFTDSTGAELAYYLWPGFDAASARVCVRLEGADAAGAVTVHYGNPSATTTSDGSAAYLLFDHFDGTTLNTTIWQNNGRTTGTGTFSVTVANSAMRVAASSSTGGTVESKKEFSLPIMIESRWRVVSQEAQHTIFDVATLNYARVVYTENKLLYQTKIGGTSYIKQEIARTPSSSYFHSQIVVTPTAFKYSENGVQLNSYTAQDVLTADQTLRYRTGGYSGTNVYFDWILVRAYSAAPPAAITFSGEQETAAPPVTAFTATPLAGLTPLTVQFTDLSTGGPTAWSWSFGDGGTSTSQNPQHTYTTPGTYTVNLTATNEYGSDYELKTDYITVYSPVTAQFTANVTGGTAPLAVQFTDLSGGRPTSWHWDFGDGNTSTAQNPQHTYTTAGTHTVTLTASHPYDSDTETKTAYITVAVLQPFPGLTLIPRDLTGNGLYTDINGNNRLDYNDLTVFFQNLAWAKTAQPTSCFDFNGNGWLDYNDVITLFSIIMEEHT
jgi:PKD repeat protein